MGLPGALHSFPQPGQGPGLLKAGAPRSPLPYRPAAPSERPGRKPRKGSVALAGVAALLSLHFVAMLHGAVVGNLDRLADVGLAPFEHLLFVQVLVHAKGHEFGAGQPLPARKGTNPIGNLSPSPPPVPDSCASSRQSVVVAAASLCQCGSSTPAPFQKQKRCDPQALTRYVCYQRRGPDRDAPLLPESSALPASALLRGAQGWGPRGGTSLPVASWGQ